MKYLTIACVVVVGAQAFTIDDVRDAVQVQDLEPLQSDVDALVDDVVSDLKEKKGNFFDDLKDKIMDTDAYHQLDDWWTHFEPTTVSDSFAWAHKHVKKNSVRTAHQMAEARHLHHRVAERRIANGRPPMMTVAQIHSLGHSNDVLAQNMFDDYDYFDNFANTIYSYFSGFIYIPGESSECSDSILTSLTAWINSVDTIKKIYLPMNWPNFQVVLQDIVASGADISYTCDINKLFTTLSHIFTVEGVTELGARVAGAAPFELVQVVNTLGDKEASTAEKAKQLGKLSATILNYHI